MTKTLLLALKWLGVDKTIEVIKKKKEKKKKEKKECINCYLVLDVLA